ncbi:hypothetical protein [Luteimonas lutimaris]|uniref:Uncharacterized protein n=1 Tax=Luteimonas lutimaris TaxID=698645 RepID=A0ABP7MYY2_9GAMM
MKTSIATGTIALLIAIAGAAFAQASPNGVYLDGKVANFALPGQDYDSPGFESLSFWSGPNGKAVDYEYGADHKRVRLRPVGPAAGGGGFAVRFPNGLVLDVVPQGKALQVSDRGGNYSKTFEWKYEGPVDGRGTFCTPCVEEADAIGFVRKHFMQ